MESGSFHDASIRTRGSGCKQTQEFPSDMRKYFFTVLVMKYYHELPKEVVKFPYLEIFKSHLDMILGNVLQVTFLKQVASRGPFQPQLFRDSVVWFLTVLRGVICLI